MDLNAYLQALTSGQNPMENMNANSMAVGQGGGVGGMPGMGGGPMGSAMGMQQENKLAQQGNMQGTEEEDMMSQFMRALIASGSMGQGKLAMQGGGQAQPQDMSQMYARAPQMANRASPNAPRALQSGGPMNAYLQALMGGM